MPRTGRIAQDQNYMYPVVRLQSLHRMRDVTSKNFGLLIAYLLPGFTLLWGGSYWSPILRSWLGTSAAVPPTVGGFLYVTLGSVAAGMTASTVRWLILDTIHGWTGLRQPSWDFSQFADKVTGYDMLNEIHYRYYQFYGNMTIALIAAFGLRWSAVGVRSSEAVAVTLLSALFFAGSRDTLQKYFQRVAHLLGTDGADSLDSKGNSTRSG